MIHMLLLILGFFMIVWGIVICVMLCVFTIKGGKGMWLITLPAILIIAILAINFTGHMLHLPPHLPYQHQIVTTINRIIPVASVSLLVMKLYERWSKKRARSVSPNPPLV